MKELITVFKLLSDETRLRIIFLLSQKELCVCQLSGVLQEAQPKISKNLSKLRDLDLVTSERREKYIFYSLNHNNDMLKVIIDAVCENMNNYPQLLSDQEGAKNSDLILAQCRV